MKRIFSLLLCLLLILQLAACSLDGDDSILSLFDQWLTDGGYQVTTTRNPDGTSTTTLTPPGTTTGPTATPTTTPTTLPTTLPTTVPSPVVPTTVPGSVAPSTAPTTVPTTVIPTTAKPTTTKPTTAIPTTVKPTTVKPTTVKPTTVKPTTVKPTTVKPTTVNTGSHTKLDYTGRYLYNLLTTQEKGWYRAIDEAVNNLQDTVNLGVDLMVNDRYQIYFIYMFDNPEHFYLGGQVSYSSSGKLYMSYSDGTTNSFRSDAVSSITSTMKANIRQRKAAFDAEVQRIISTIPTNIPDVEKELMIYDRLLIDMCYNKTAATGDLWDGYAEVNWTAYGGIINKAGVCEAYAEAFQTLCYAVGINCTGIVGTANGGSHKWNAVQLEGQWYACDVTFDDPLTPSGTEYRPGQANFHNFFNCTTAQMEQEEHSTADSKFPGPNCTATKYSYKNYFE